MPFISKNINWLGIDSVQCPMYRRLKVWELLSGEYKPTVLDGDLVNEVSLEKLPDVLGAIMAGKVRGRTLVRSGCNRKGTHPRMGPFHSSGGS